jgi:polyhydroxyalkanoate synthase subunit PhaC
MLLGSLLIEVDHPWEDALKSDEEFRNRQSDIPDHVADSLAGQNMLVDLRISELLDTAARLFDRAFRNPAAMAEEVAQLARELQNVANGKSTWAPPRNDKRFSDPAWTENTFYKSLLQGYMAWSQSLQNFAEKAGFETKETGRAKFLLTQISEALAPTNFLFSNPAAVKAAIDSGGKTLLEGYHNFLEDAVEGRPVPSQVDFGSFKVGDNLAMTPGDVVMRHEMFELIQYSPLTEQVWHRPILFVPSIINKYYAFDLAPGRSLFEFLVKSGFTLFSMVFRNPRPEHDHWGMDAYVGAIDAAFRAVQEIRGVEDPHTIAVCGAAPLVVSLAGYYAAQGQRNIGSMTLFVAPLDTLGMTETPGLGAFVDPKLNEVVKRWPASKDRVSADELTLLFAMLRPNDLIWNYWVNNYLLGKQPAAFDVLYWNADGTGMTAQYNRDFRKFVDENPLVRSGAMTVKGTSITDISRLDFDSYVIGAASDHICPWPTVYRSAQMLGERCQFILGGSGHIQTIVCPPGNPKAVYYTNPDNSNSPEDWLRTANKSAGTWWDHFSEWCGKRSGAMVPAPSSPGSARLPSLGKAPGTYVFEKVR